MKSALEKALQSKSPWAWLLIIHYRLHYCILYYLYIISYMIIPDHNMIEGSPISAFTSISALLSMINNSAIKQISVKRREEGCYCHSLCHDRKERTEKVWENACRHDYDKISLMFRALLQPHKILKERPSKLYYIPPYRSLLMIGVDSLLNMTLDRWSSESESFLFLCTALIYPPVKPSVWLLLCCLFHSLLAPSLSSTCSGALNGFELTFLTYSHQQFIFIASFKSISVDWVNIIKFIKASLTSTTVTFCRITRVFFDIIRIFVNITGFYCDVLPSQQTVLTGCWNVSKIIMLNTITTKSTKTTNSWSLFAAGSLETIAACQRT